MFITVGISFLDIEIVIGKKSNSNCIILCLPKGSNKSVLLKRLLLSLLIPLIDKIDIFPNHV